MKGSRVSKHKAAGVAYPFECGGVLPITIRYGSITPAIFVVLLSNSLACLRFRSEETAWRLSPLGILAIDASTPIITHRVFLIPKLDFTPIFLKRHLVICSPAVQHAQVILRQFFLGGSLITLVILYSVVCAIKVTGTLHVFFKLAGKVTVRAKPN